MPLPPEFEPPYHGIDDLIYASKIQYDILGPHVICGFEAPDDSLTIHFLTIESLNKILNGSMDLSRLNEMVESYDPELQAVIIGLPSRIYCPLTIFRPSTVLPLEQGWLRRLVNERGDK